MLVDDGYFEIDQDKLENLLFKSLVDAGYGDAEINRFKMVSTFQHSRRPLIILLFGVPCAAKTMVTQQLSYRLNLPHVLRTDALEEILKHHPEVYYDDPSEYLLSTHDAIGCFSTNCKTIRQALHGEFLKVCLVSFSLSDIEARRTYSEYEYRYPHLPIFCIVIKQTTVHANAVCQRWKVDNH